VTIILCTDDLYKTKEDRKGRSRLQPGSIDPKLKRTLRLLKNAQAGEVEVPQFEKGLDDRVAPKVVRAPFDLIIFEGWRVGVEGQFKGWTFDLDELNREIDLFVFIDANLEDCKRWKIKSSREDCIKNGMDWTHEKEEVLKGKWDEWIGPYAKQIILPLKAKADFVLSYDERRISTLRKQDGYEPIVVKACTMH